MDDILQQQLHQQQNHTKRTADKVGEGSHALEIFLRLWRRADLTIQPFFHHVVQNIEGKRSIGEDSIVELLDIKPISQYLFRLISQLDYLQLSNLVSQRLRREKNRKKRVNQWFREGRRGGLLREYYLSRDNNITIYFCMNVALVHSRILPHIIHSIYINE